MDVTKKSRIVPPNDMETYVKGKASPVEEPAVSLTKSGYFVYNPPAYAALGEPKAVEYSYSPSTGIVGFRAVDPDDQHAYPVYRQGKSRNWQSSGKAFQTHYGIPPVQKAVRHIGELIGDTLYIDLGDGEAISAGRRKAEA
jgi:hypothetical protein